MPVVAADLLRPPTGTGVLRADLLHDGQSALTALLTPALALAYAEAGAVVPALTPAQQDIAARAYGNATAYLAKWEEMNAQAASISLADQGSRAYFVTQIDNYEKMAQSELAAYRALVPLPLPTRGPSIASGWLGTGSLR